MFCRRHTTTMTSSYGDGSWQLSVSVIELNVDRTLRVKGDLHIGGLMLQIVDGLDVTTDWSDYALWWPAKSLWLLRTRSTLDQYGVQADAHIEFTRMHKNIQVLLPDLQLYETLVNFSANVFTVVIKISKELGIRHPEEMSLSRRLEPEELKRNRGASATRRSRSSSLRSPSTPGTPGTASQYMSLGSLLDNGRGSCSTIHSPGRCTPSRFTSRESLLRTSSVPRSSYCSGLRTPYSPCTVPFNANGMLSPNSVNSLFFNSATDCNSPFVNSPYISTSQAFQLLYRPTSLQEKARINAGWYDSSRSLMEQGVTENCIVLLRFKFFAFYDLNPKFDAVRINEIYEQAKWSILSEEINCTLDEMFLFAALQLQVQIQSHLSELSPEGTTNGRCSAYSSEVGNGRCSFYSQGSATNGHCSTYSPSSVGATSGYCSTHSSGATTNGRCSVREETTEDQIDAALNELQKALEDSVDGPVDGLDSTNTSQLAVSTASRTDVTHVPQLADVLRYFKPKKGLWWRSYRKYYFVFKDVTLSMYRTATSKELLSSASLKGCDVSADVSVSASRYIIKLFLPSSVGQTMSEVWLRTETEDQYARWMAAIKLASKGRTMADTAAYETEQRTIVSLLQLQRCNQTTSPSPVTASPPGNGGDTPASLPGTPGLVAGSQLNILPPDFIAPRFLHKLRSKHMVQRILDGHNNVCNMSLTDAKLQYIQAWQSLPEHGLTYFIVKFKGSRKEDLLGVAYNRLVRLDMQTGDTLRTWRFPNMKSWSVNWNIREVNVSFEEEDLAFQCLTADCKVVHEFIGGYIFLSMRSADRSQTLNEELFHKLTGGWT